jgi:hypothetical protein
VLQLSVSGVRGEGLGTKCRCRIKIKIRMRSRNLISPFANLIHNPYLNPAPAPAPAPALKSFSSSKNFALLFKQHINHLNNLKRASI